MNRLIVAHLKALYLISKTKQRIRNFDNTLAIRNTDGKSRLVATNGHILLELSYDVFIAEDQVIAVADILPILALDKSTEVKIENQVAKAGKVSCTLSNDNNDYPDYVRTIPSQLNGVGANFNFKYLTIFDKVRSLLGVKDFRIAYNGQDANMVEITNNVRGIIMPLRD